MPLDQLLEIDNKLQPLLREGYYSFIAPIDGELLTNFIKIVQRIAPGNFFDNSVHSILSNKEATKKALVLFSGNECRIYVVNSKMAEVLLYDTVEGYCEKNQIPPL